MVGSCRCFYILYPIMKHRIYLIIPILFFIGLSLTAQEKIEANDIFVRVYDGVGFKIGKGKLHTIDKNSITLKRNKKLKTIDIVKIGSIKTKRAFGHNVGMGALAGMTMGIIYGFAQGSDGGAFGTNSGSDNAIVFGSLGLIVGPIAGGLSGIGKQSIIFEINQDIDQLAKFKEFINNQ